MKHEELKELLPLYIDGGLDKDEVELVEAHLAECEECRQELTQYQAHYDFLTSSEDVEVSADFLASVMKRVEIEKEKREGAGASERRVERKQEVTWWERLRGLMGVRLRIPVGVMSLAAVAVIVVLLMGPLSGLYRDGVRDDSPGYGLRGEVQYEMYDMKEAPVPAPMQKTNFTAPQTARNVSEEAPASGETDRKIIKTASLRVEVKDITEAEKQVMNIARDLDGFISHSSSWVSGANQRYTNYQLRIPADGFYDALERVEMLGTIKNRELGGQDVTEEYFDIQSRLKNLLLQEERYRELLVKATDVEDMLAIERELERIRGNIESLQGRINYLDNKINMSTISVELSEPQPIAPSNNWGILEVLRQAIREMLDTFYNMIVRLGRMMPYLILIGLAYLIYRYVRRRRK